MYAFFVVHRILEQKEKKGRVAVDNIKILFLLLPVAMLFLHKGRRDQEDREQYNSSGELPSGQGLVGPCLSVFGG